MKHILLSVAIVIALLTGCSSSDSTRAISELSENEARELAISALAEDDIQNGSGEFTLEQHLEIAECSIDYMKNNSDYTVKPLKKTGVQRGMFAATRTECLDKPFMRNLIDLAGQEAGRLQKD